MDKELAPSGEIMKYGTLKCKLFGHKCVLKYDQYNKKAEGFIIVIKQLDFCSRCGCPKGIPFPDYSLPMGFPQEERKE